MEHTAITHLDRKMIFPTSMIMFHVNLPGCSKSLVNPMKNAMELGHLGRRIARLRGRKLAMGYGY